MDWFESRKKKIETSLRTRFLTGLVIVLPAALSLYIFYRIFDFFDSFFDPLLIRFFGRTIPGLGVVLLLLLIFFAGTLATNVFGNRILSFVENGMSRIPVFKKLYATLKTMVESFSPSGTRGFRKVVLAEYPSEGVYTLGFLTGWVRVDDPPGQYASVFFPSNNLYIGVNSLLPPERVRVTAIPIEEGMKLILSGGLSLPEYLATGPLEVQTGPVASGGIHEV
ncbi:MAG: DUF502 domain-containing protein [Nitrospirae bacterium]|nr:DUF502 domain-containing protein [Nitrospirota bacterium]